MSSSYFSSNIRILSFSVLTTLLSVVVWASTPNAARGEAGMSPAVVQTKERVLKQSSFPEEPMTLEKVFALPIKFSEGMRFTSD